MLLLCGPAMASDVLPPPLIGNPAEEQVQQEPPRDAEGETQSPEETPQASGETASLPSSGQTAESGKPIGSGTFDENQNLETMEAAKTAETAETAEEPALLSDVVEDAGLDSVIYDFEDTTSVTNLSDETFYGKYNPETKEWEKDGYFDYEAHPEMDSIKEAVMQADGDYTEVKEAVFEYYRTKRGGMNLDVPSKQDAQSRYLADTLEHNLYFHPSWKMLGSSTVDGGDQYISFDVSPIWDEIKISSDKAVSFYLMAFRKDGNEAVFSSKEGEHPPILEVESNGVVTPLTASDDATVSAGTNDMKNYGSEPTLRVEESVSSIGGSQPTDSNTKRAHVKFDLSELSLTSSVSRVTLKLYGKNATSEEEKEILAFKVPTNSWTEDLITFKTIDGDSKNNYENMAFSWDGEKYLRFIMPNYCGYRYREEQDRFETWFFRFAANYVHVPADNERYAAIALRQWVGWLEQTGTNAKGNPAYWHNLDLGCRLICMPEDLMRFFDSKYMTPDIWSATLKYMWKSEYEIAYNNWLINMSNNTGIVGARALHNGNCFFNEFRMYDDALERVRKKMDQVISSSLIGKEGSYLEDSLAYASMSAGNTIGYLKSNRITGNPDLPFRNDEQFDSARVIVRSIINLAAPGMRDNQWGDSAEYTTTYNGPVKSAYKEFDDPVIAYFATDGKEGNLPPYTSYMYNDTKRMVMRSDWGENAVYLFSDVGGTKANHGHHDDNAIILCAYGRQLLSDQLYYSYSTGTVKNYIESATAHNTVTVDEKNQHNTGRGQINFWETNSIYDNSSNVTFANQAATVNEKHTRNILYLRSGFVLVSDYMKPYDTDLGNHSYQQLWHMPPDAQITLDEDSLAGRSNVLADANVQVIPVNDGTMTGTIENGYYVATTADYLRYEKEGSGPVLFDTVLYPERPGQTAEITTEKIDLEDVQQNGATASHICIESQKDGISDICYYLVHDSKQQKARRFGNYETDARLAYVERDGRGNLKQFVIQDGTYIKDLTEDQILFQSKQPVAQFGGTLNQGAVDLASSTVSDLTDLTLLANAGIPVISLAFNGQNTVPKNSGRYIYFGDEPILKDDTPDPEPPQKPSGSGGGGGSVNRPGGGIGGGSSGGNYTPAASAAPTAGPTAEPAKKPSDAYREELDSFWGRQEAAELVDKGIFQGKGDRLDLYGTVTRGEFAAVLARAMEWELSAYQDGTFLDVQKGDWYADVIQTAKERGIIQGSSDGLFYPNNSVTREEMAKMLVLALDAGIDSRGDLSYQDLEAISDWAVPYVKAAAELGLIQGDENHHFNPKQNTARGEAAVVIWRLLNSRDSAQKDR